MLKISSKYVDSLNTALIILTCAVAHALPYQLLIVSYAVLGPAHYLTQISWLHDRRYFTQSSWLLALLLGLISLAIVVLAVLFTGHRLPNLSSAQVTNVIALLLSAALAISLIFVVPSRYLFRLVAALG